MNSIIVLDSSDEEGGTVKKKRGARNNQPPQHPVTVQPPMARVNPVKAPNSAMAVKKTQAPLPNDNFKIQLPSKRPTQQIQSDLVPPEKRVRRVKPTTVMRSNDEEWIKRPNTAQWNGEERPKGNNQSTTKNLMNVLKNTSTTVVKNSTTVGPNVIRGVQNNNNRNNPIQSTNKSPANFVRMAWNGKNPKPSSPPVINKNITTTLKEQPKGLPMPPVINKNITATAKDPNIPSSLSSSPVFNKNSVTIRRIVVNDDRPKPVALAKSITTPKPLITNPNSLNIKKPLPGSIHVVDPLKITMSPSKNLNNSSIKVTQINATSPATPINQSSTSFRKIPSTATELVKGYQHLPTLKRNDNNAKLVQQDPIAVVSTSPTMLYSSPATVKKMVNVELPTKPTASSTIPVITKVFGSGVSKKIVNEQQPLIHLGTSVITKNQVKQPEPTTLPSVVHKPPPAIMNRPSGLIVTPITCTVVTTTTPTPSYNMPSNTMPNSSRGTSKQSKASISRSRAFQAVQAEQALASMFNMFPPGNFMGNPQMMYDMDPSGGAFINPACIPNRPMRTMEGTSFPTISSPGFHMNYPNFSGGSITPVMSPGPNASPTYNSGRSSKSPVTSTVTRPSSATRSPASYMGISIDVDQPIPPMSPPVYNMNHVPYNGDPFNFMRNPHNIPSPSFSPVRSTRSPLSAGPKTASKGTAESGKPPASSSVYHKDLDSFVKSPFSYPQTPPNNTKTTPPFTNGPIISLDSPPNSQTPVKSPTPAELFKTSSVNLLSSPAQSTMSDGSSISEVYSHQLPPNGKEKPSTSDKTQEKKSQKEPAVEEIKDDDDGDEEDQKEDQEEEEKEPLILEFEKLLKICREADSSEDMNRLIESKLIRYYYSVHPDFVKSRGFKKAVVAATESIKKNAELVYYHLRPVVEELKARKKCRAIVMTNDEMSAVAAEAEQEGIEDKVRNRQIRRLNKGLYILTRKIHKLETDEVDLEDENSTYLIVERYKKRACEIYDKICDLTGESKHALRQVKKPITFKETDYPKFNKVVETFVNKTKEFPDFVDVLRMLEFCNDRYNFGLLKEEMTSIAQGAFIKIGKLLQSRRKADLYETVSHFTSDLEDPADNDPVLLAKLIENEKNQTSIGSIIEKYAREQVGRKAESTSVSDDDVNNSSESCGFEEESHNIKQSKTQKDSNKTKKEGRNKDIDKDKDKKDDINKDIDKDKKDEKNKNIEKDKKNEICEKPIEATTNGTHSPSPTAVVVSPSLPLASTSAAFRTSPPHAFESPEASPRPSPLSPLLPSCTTSSLKILSVTSLNEIAHTSSPKKNIEIIKPAAAVGSVDEIVISDEDL